MSENFEKEYKESIGRAKNILGNCNEPIDTNVREAIEAIFPILKKDKTDDQKWKILKSMVHSNVPDNIYRHYKLDRDDFERWLDDRSKEISALKDQIESLTEVLKLFYESKHKPVISREVIKEGVANFGITQHQIDNWLKKYFNIIDQDPCEDCKHPMLNCHNFPCMEKIVFSKGKTIHEVMKPDQLNKQENVNCNAGLEFHKGDWVVKGSVVAQILDVQEQYYIGIDTEGNDFTVSRFLSKDKIRLWSITDAKEGDILANDHHILILKELDYDWYTNGTPYSVKAYCGIKPNGNFELGRDNWCFCGTLHIHPATKEQRNLLFTKMKEAGYVWDVKKKELKEIEQKPADKFETKFKIEKGKWYVCIRDLLDNYANRAFHKGDIYLSTQDGSLIPSNSNVPFEVVCPDTYFREWTIQDARDGDVLAVDVIESHPSPFVAICKKQNGESFETYCFIGHDGKFYKGEIGHASEYVHPATREQRNALIKAMASAGYTFDFEKKS